MIIQSLQKLMDTGVQPYAKVCVVHRVDKANKCCDVIPVDGSAELFDVPFHPNETDEGLCLYPAINSHVLVVFINKHHACICQLSKLDMMKLTIGQVKFSVDEKGFLLKKDDETLKELMNDLLKAIQAMDFKAPNGPCVLQPDSIKKLGDIQTRFNSFLKDDK